MSWYPTDDSKLPAFRSTSATAPISSSSTLGRMPLSPTYAAPLEAEVTPRADFLHVMLRAALGANSLAPLAAPAYILDVGCGSGRWVREMASAFPAARVVGVDSVPPTESNPAISGVFPQAAMMPRNYAFVQRDVMEPLGFTPASFHLTHMRQMMGVIPLSAWPRVVGEMALVTAPGGWVELVESDLVRNGGPALETMRRWALQALLPQGFDPRVSAQTADLLRTLSLRDVRMRTVELPVGPHGGRFGELMGVDLLARIEGLRGRIIAARVASPEAFAQAQMALQQEMNRSAYVQPVYVACGRR